MYRYLTLAAVLAFAAGPASAQIVMIDNFEDPNSAASLVVDRLNNSVSDTDTGLDEDTVIAGARGGNLYVPGLLSLDPNEYVGMEINGASSGVCFFTSSSTVSVPVDGDLLYGSFDGRPQLDADWTDLTKIIVDVQGLPAQVQNIDVHLWWREGTPQANSTWVWKTLTTSDSSLVFGLSEFIGLDPNDVDRIMVRLRVPGGQSLAIEEIYVIPDPASAAALLIGTVGVLWRRHRR